MPDNKVNSSGHLDGDGDPAEGGDRGKPKKKRRFVLWGILIVLVLLVGAVGVTAYLQRGNLKALKYAASYSEEELTERSQDLESRTQAAVARLPDIQLTPLTDEERRQLKDGTLSPEAAAEKITSVPASEAGELVTILGDFYLLKAEFLNNIDDLIEQGKAEVRAMPAENRTLTGLMDTAKKYLQQGSDLEAACDKRMDELLERLKAELSREGQDVSLVNEIRELYNEEKALKKADLIAEYYPKE